MKYLILLAAVLFLMPAPAARAQVYGDPGSLVNYWYRTYLGRTPDPSGIITWVNALNQGQPPDAVLSSILGSDEYYQRAGSTPDWFIARLYADVVGRSPTPSELDFWVRRLYTEDRQAVADEILNQNPGVWVGTGPPVATPPAVVVTPGLEYRRYDHWDRDRREDWDRHRNIYEYRRPAVPYHHEEHHERGRR